MILTKELIEGTGMPELEYGETRHCWSASTAFLIRKSASSLTKRLLFLVYSKRPRLLFSDSI